MIRFVVFLLGWLMMLVLMVGCSSAPKSQYDVTTYQNMTLKLLALADRKRQQGSWGQANTLYLEAEKYAIKRNDKYLLGLSFLKRAAIAIAQGRQTQAAMLIKNVEQMVKFERVDLAQGVDFVNAKMAQAKGDDQKAIALYRQLEVFYQHDAAKASFYRFKRWHVDEQEVAITQIEQDLQLLRQHYEQHQLDNVEIFSFALFAYLQWQVRHQQQGVEGILTEALEHFSRLELGNKIAECYLLGADFYRRQGDIEKADYYQIQASKINLVL